MDEKKFTTKQFVEMALLTAVIVLMAFTPIGYIKTFGLEITLIVVPVTVGAVTLGPFLSKGVGKPRVYGCECGQMRRPKVPVVTRGMLLAQP